MEDLHICFADLINLTVPRWVNQPLSSDPADLKVELQDQFIDLQNDDKFKMKFTEDMYDIFWCKASGKYPLIWNKVRPWILSFPTSCFVEKWFSAVTLLLSKQSNYLSIRKRSDLRLYLTKMSSNNKKLVEDHQDHSSH